MEEDQLQRAGLVRAFDPVGSGPAPRAVPIHGHAQGDDGARWGLGDLGREAAVDEAARQVPQQVHDLGPGQPLDGLADARPDPAKCGHRGEERKQDFGSHGHAAARRNRRKGVARSTLSAHPDPKPRKIALASTRVVPPNEHWRA